MLLVVLAGIAAFLLHNNQNSDAVSALGPWALALFIPANSFALFIHELGHAFTTKAFGREVLRGGIGWYWFGPIGFIDTSDMWLAGRWPRIAVSIAGPYSDVVLASIAALVSTQVESEVGRAVLWQISFAGYSSMFFNLSPLLEFDGYFILSDYLDRPNLRPSIMAWLGQELPRLVAERRQIGRAHV